VGFVSWLLVEPFYVVPVDFTLNSVFMGTNQSDDPVTLLVAAEIFQRAAIVKINNDVFLEGTFSTRSDDIVTDLVNVKVKMSSRFGICCDFSQDNFLDI